MSRQSDLKINNAVVISTIAEVTKQVIKRLDGDGVDTQDPQNPVSDEVLNQLIASRIRNRLSERTR